jgi:hypothetical protein
VGKGERVLFSALGEPHILCAREEESRSWVRNAVVPRDREGAHVDRGCRALWLLKQVQLGAAFVCRNRASSRDQKHSKEEGPGGAKERHGGCEDDAPLSEAGRRRKWAAANGRALQAVKWLL